MAYSTFCSQNIGVLEVRPVLSKSYTVERLSQREFRDLLAALTRLRAALDAGDLRLE